MTSPNTVHILSGLETFDFGWVTLPPAKPYHGESQHAAVRGATNRVIKAFNAHVGHEVLALEVSGRGGTGHFGEFYVQGVVVNIKPAHRSFRPDQEMTDAHIAFMRRLFDALVRAGWNQVQSSRGTDRDEWSYPSFSIVGPEVAEHSARAAQIKAETAQRKIDREAAAKALADTVREGFAKYNVDTRVDEFNQTVSLAAVRDLLAAVENRYDYDTSTD